MLPPTKVNDLRRWSRGERNGAPITMVGCFAHELACKPITTKEELSACSLPTRIRGTGPLHVNSALGRMRTIPAPKTENRSLSLRGVLF
jgi:hypothetical protein